MLGHRCDSPLCQRAGGPALGVGSRRRQHGTGSSGRCGGRPSGTRCGTAAGLAVGLGGWGIGCRAASGAALSAVITEGVAADAVQLPLWGQRPGRVGGEGDGGQRSDPLRRRKGGVPRPAPACAGGASGADGRSVAGCVGGDEVGDPVGQPRSPVAVLAEHATRVGSAAAERAATSSCGGVEPVGSVDAQRDGPRGFPVPDDGQVRPAAVRATKDSGREGVGCVGAGCVPLSRLVRRRCSVCGAATRCGWWC